MAPLQIVDHRRDPYGECDPNLRVHRVSLKLTARSSGCAIPASVRAGLAAAAPTRELPRVRISGAKNPACRANSASAFPDGRRQHIESIHSIGMWPPPSAVRLRAVALLRAFKLSGFMVIRLLTNPFDRLGGFH
jgi:hypothetical protein